jgi:hypothetical protein
MCSVYCQNIVVYTIYCGVLNARLTSWCESEGVVVDGQNGKLLNIEQRARNDGNCGDCFRASTTLTCKTSKCITSRLVTNVHYSNRQWHWLWYTKIVNMS